MSSTSRSTPNPRWIYDVFLNFRGRDTRAIFVSHLYNSLTNAGIYVFKDNEELPLGGQISESLLQAIQVSNIAIIVFSRNYGNSKWCLKELEKIMDCRRTKRQVVIPVFYNIDPSDVGYQKGAFGKAFQQLRKRVSNHEIRVWEKILGEASKLSGFHLNNSSNESDDIDHIVAMVTGLLDKPVLFVAEHPVGVEPRVQHLIKKLNYQQPEDVMLLGILGIGGIGKTTIAKAIYNRIHRHFDGCCFLPDIRESWEQSTSQVHLQERLLRDIYKKTKIRIHSVESGKIILQERLSRKRVLLILDDVDKPDQLKALCWNRKWFGPGSRIIITTRDEHLLKILKVDHVSRISKMDDTESIEQLSWHAFKQKKPKEDFVQLSKDVVAYCGGLPLALEVIGSFLIEKKAKEWQSAVEKLKRIPNSDVHKKLRISFDGLNDDAEREIFLDIAFFFIGMDRNDVIHVLEEHDAEIGISVLVDRSLVTVDNNNKLGMHDLLRDMGREIVREKSPKYPGRRCRLCLQNDVLDVLLKHTGTKDLEGLALRLPRTNSYCLETKAFMKMERLRLLQLANVKLEGNFEDLPKDLKWLYWHGFPFDYLPSNFYLASSIAIEFEFSSLRTWKDVQYMEKLKILNLSHSNLLTQTPNSSYLPNLEKLLLKDCPNLCEISDSIEKLTKILLIDLEDCKSLPNLRRSFYKLKSLKTLNISGCSMINKLEEDLEQMTSLITLIADKTGITQVPFSIVRSKSIGYISLCGYEGFSSDVFPSLIRSWMSPPGNLLSFVQTSACSELVPLDVQKLRLLSVKCSIDFQLTEGVTRILDTLCATYNKQLEATPTTSQVMNIRSLTAIDSCNQFRIWGPLLIEVGIKSQLTSNLRDRIIQELEGETNNAPDNCLLPSDKYWLSFNCEGSSVAFKVPHVQERKLKAMMLSIVYSSSSDPLTSEYVKNLLIINYTKCTIQVCKGDALPSLEDEEWQSIASNLEPGNIVEVLAVCFGYGLVVKRTTVYLVYDEPIDQLEHSDADIIVSGVDDMTID